MPFMDKGKKLRVSDLGIRTLNSFVLCAVPPITLGVNDDKAFLLELCVKDMQSLFS
jgi:hypothetical protein